MVYKFNPPPYMAIPYFYMFFKNLSPFDIFLTILIAPIKYGINDKNILMEVSSKLFLHV